MIMLMLTLACSSNGAKVVLPDDTASVVNVDTGTDTASRDTADTGTGGGDTADTLPPPEDVSGDYAGDAEGMLEPLEGGDRGPRPEACDGEATLRIATDGDVSGAAWCTTRDGFGPEGTLTGQASEGSLAVTWTIRTGRGTQEIGLSGTVGGDVIVLDGAGDDGRMQVTIHIEATR